MGGFVQDFEVFDVIVEMDIDYCSFQTSEFVCMEIVQNAQSTTQQENANHVVEALG